MIFDTRALPVGTVREADVCVVGAGPVGIAVAQAVARSGLTVILLESGGLEKDRAADALGEPQSLEFGRVRSLGNSRVVGGNATRWHVRTGATWRGVRLMPMGDADLAGSAGEDPGAWPLEPSEFRRHVAQAQGVFGLPAVDFDAASWATGREDQLVEGEADIASAVFQFGDGGALVSRAMAELKTSSRVELLYYATAQEILTTDDASVATGVRVSSAPGHEITVQARHIVVAAGCISSTQLLLASDAVRPAGLGNLSDQLGRNFMDHPILQGGELWPEAGTDFSRFSLYDLHTVGRVPIMGHLQLTAQAIRRDGLLNLSTMLYPREANYREHGSLSERQRQGFASAIAIRNAAARRQAPGYDDLKRLVLGADGVIKTGLDRFLRPKAGIGRGGWAERRGVDRFACFEVVHQAEQAPHADNRISLGDGRDALGMRKVVVSWRWHAEDRERTVRAQKVFAQAFERIGWGEFRLTDADDPQFLRSSSSNHFMGTTRMSAAAEDGVVDPHGAVHGTPNLFVASSSVFPSGGYANATLSAVALGLRSAEAVIDRHQALSLSTAL